jgi:putative peptide zinc metalloprotease protein
MLVTIPLLLLLLLIMVRSVPRVLATAWDSLGQQGQALVAAQGYGNVLGIVGAAGQALLLLIPTLGLGYTLLSLGRRLSVGVWKWGEPSVARRIARCACLLGCAGLLGFMWAPQLKLPDGSSVSAGPISQTSWEPIRAEERGTVLDALAGVIATPEPAASVTPESTAPQDVAPAPRQAVEPTLNAQANATSTPAADSTTPVPTPGAPGGASPVPRVATTPTAPTGAVVQPTRAVGTIIPTATPVR